MARMTTNDRKAFGAGRPRTRELTEAELDAVPGGFAGSMSQNLPTLRDQRTVSPT